MKKCYKITFGLLLVIFVFMLFGCMERTNYRPMQIALPKKSSIGVMSFLGNKVTVYLTHNLSLTHDLFPKKCLYELSGINYDNYLVDSIKQVLRQKGITNITAYHLPKNNPITNETCSKVMGRIKKVQSFELKYIKSKIKGKRFDYIIIILPKAIDSNVGYVAKYGIFDADDRAVTTFYAAYRIYVLDGRTYKIVSQKYEYHFVEVPGFTLNYKQNLPLMTNKQRSFYRLWLLNFVGNNIKKDVLMMFNLMD